MVLFANQHPPGNVLPFPSAQARRRVQGSLHNTSFLQNTGFKVIARPTQHRKLNNEGLVEFHHQVSAALSLECMQNETGRLALHDAEGEEV